MIIKKPPEFTCLDWEEAYQDLKGLEIKVMNEPDEDGYVETEVDVDGGLKWFVKLEWLEESTDRTAGML